MHGITFAYLGTGENANMGKTMPGTKHYKVTIKYGDKQETFVYSMGPGLNHPPYLEDVLLSLSLDSQAYNMPYKEWRGEFGYESNAEAKRIYAACMKEAKQMLSLLGEELFKQFLTLREDDAARPCINDCDEDDHCKCPKA